jgi:hypothetical protein
VWRILLFVLLLANIVLSYRRTVWIGLFMGMGWLGLKLRGRGKLMTLVVAGCIVIALGGWVASQRFSGKTWEGKNKSISSDISDKKKNISLQGKRFVELTLSIKTLLENNPLWGVGTWTRTDGKQLYSHDATTLSFREEKRLLFMHSAVIHVLFKLGFVGLFIFLGIFYRYVLGWQRANAQMTKQSLPYLVGESAFAAWIFMLPDIFFGTPFIIFRHAQVLALLIGLTWAATRIRTNNVP